MKTMRKAAALLLLAALLCTLLAGCGNAKKKFKVSFVGVTSLTGGSKYIQGTCDKKTYKLSLSCFEGYTPVELSFDDPSNVKMTGTSNGGMRFADPVNLILKDGSGNTRTVRLEEGVTFDAVADGDSLKLILP